jgi:signal transduction histidine kinase
MKNDKYLVFIILQFIVITGLFILDIFNHTISLNNGVLYFLSYSVTIILLMKRLQLRKQLTYIIHELDRVTKGNLKRRLLAKDDGLFNEVIFSMNEIIGQLERVQIQSMKSQAARKNLLSSISHDIRTPLTSIIGYIDALRDDIATSEEEKQDYIEILSKKATGLKKLIDEIFLMAKLDADEIPIRKEPLDLAEFTRELLIEFLPEVKNSNMELRLNIPETDCMISVDHLSLIRIIRNIINNAIVYGKDGGVLGIEIIEKAKGYQLLIWDQGQGIQKENLENVFDRMFRGDQSRNSLNKGSGLGLAIVKSLVKKNSGTIWVESIPWKKTTFGVSIPKPFKK